MSLLRGLYCDCGTCIRIIFIAYLLTQNNYEFQQHRSVQLVNYHKYRHRTAIILLARVYGVIWSVVPYRRSTIEPTRTKHVRIITLVGATLPTTSHSTVGTHVSTICAKEANDLSAGKSCAQNLKKFMTISSNAWNIKTTTESDGMFVVHAFERQMKYDGQRKKKLLSCKYLLYGKLAWQWFNVHWSFRDIFSSSSSGRSSIVRFGTNHQQRGHSQCRAYLFISRIDYWQRVFPMLAFGHSIEHIFTTVYSLYLFTMHTIDWTECWAGILFFPLRCWLIVFSTFVHKFNSKYHSWEDARNFRTTSFDFNFT